MKKTFLGEHASRPPRPPPPLLGQGMEDLAIPTLKSCENIGPPPSSNIGPKEKISFLI